MLKHTYIREPRGTEVIGKKKLKLENYSFSKCVDLMVQKQTRGLVYSSVNC